MMRRFTFIVLAGLAALFCCQSTLRATPTYDQFHAYFVQYEGYRQRPYWLRGNLHVGIGHNLTASHEHAKSRYTPDEIEFYFVRDLEKALSIARAGVHCFDTLPNDVQLVVVGLAFGTGTDGFTRFYAFREALNARDYTRAARELKNSRWARQVGPDRAANHIAVLRAAAVQVRVASAFINPQ